MGRVEFITERQFGVDYKQTVQWLGKDVPLNLLDICYLKHVRQDESISLEE